MRARIEANLREQFQPENDEEWAIIKERIQKVSELRRASAGGMMGAMMAGGAFRGMMTQGGRMGENAAGPRGRMGMSPETEALQTSLARIPARLLTLAGVLALCRFRRPGLPRASKRRRTSSSRIKQVLALFPARLLLRDELLPLRRESGS
jgi:hypothetical protein